MASKYQFWLTWNNEADKIRIPVLPDEYHVKIGNNDESVDVAGLGETTVLQNRPAFYVSFSSFFPSTYFKGCEVGVIPPSTYVKKIRQWKSAEQLKPCHIIITSSDVNFFCTIENFEYWEKGGDVGTLYYSIELKEFRAIKMRNISFI